MDLKIVIFILFFGIYSLNAYAATSRDLLIQKEMDCIEQNKNSGVTWADVCSMPEVANSQNDQAINQQMNQAQAIAPTQATAPLFQETSTNAFNGREHTFTISPQEFYYHYSEPEKARLVTGPWAGIEADYTFRPPQDNIFNNPVFNYYSVETLYATGKSDIKEEEQRASDNSFTKLILNDITGYIFEDRALIGRDLIPLPNLRLTPYTGFGVRYQTDHSSGHLNILDDDQTAIAGYDRSELYLYIPTGLSMDLAAFSDYEISLKMEYDYLVKGYARYDYGTMDQFTVPLGGFTNQNLQYTQGHGWGSRSSLKILRHFSLVDIYFEPYVRYWHINASKAASGNVGGADFINTANKNTTFELGSSLGVQF